MKKEEMKNQKDSDTRSNLFTISEAFQKIQKLIEEAKRQDAKGEIQREELKRAIQDILERTELYGQILPNNWQKFEKIEELEKVIIMAKICFTKPAYIV